MLLLFSGTVVLALGLAGRAAAAPIPVEGVVEDFSAAIVYSIAPDGSNLLRRDRRTGRLQVFPVGADGSVEAPIDLSRYRLRFPVWARDGTRLHGIGHRDRRPILRSIDPARPEEGAREVPLEGLDGQVFAVSRHPAEDDRDQLVVWTFGSGEEVISHCEPNRGRCTKASPAIGRGWRSMIDHEGRPAARHRFEGAAREIEVRVGDVWKPAGSLIVDRVLAPLTPIGSGGWGMALSNFTRDTISLVRWNPRTLEERVVASYPDADLQRVLISESGEPLAAISFPDYPRTTALHPAAERVLELAGGRHPEPALVNVVAADRRLQRFVVEIFDEVHARAAYLISLDRNSVVQFDRSPAGRRFRGEFSPTRAVRIPAPDGLMLPGLLTLPRAAAGSDAPPLVLMIHGGPWLFYRWTFDPLSQLLASRGYAVLKINYRGSAGYGNRFREAAAGELAGRILEDLEGALDWAVREGFADRSRLALLGDSFGGFCVLATIARSRIPVRAGVIVNGVVDTEAMVDENTFSAEGRALWAKYLGTEDLAEMRRILREVSPLRHRSRIRAPVLFVTGNEDRVVQARHAARFVEALQREGRPAEILTFPAEGHAIAKPANVSEAYRGILGFLERRLR